MFLEKDKSIQLPVTGKRFSSDHENKAPVTAEMLFVVTRYDCKFACSHCFFSSNPNAKGVLPKEALNRAIDFAPSLGIRGVMLSGGEPMMDPGTVIEAVDRIDSKGMYSNLQSTYLGDTPEEAEDHASYFGVMGMREFITSVSLYHEKTKPDSVKMPYLDYVVMMADAMSRNGMAVGIKNPWDVENARASEEQTHEFMVKMIKAGAYVVRGQNRPMDLVAMNGQPVKFIDPSVISVGHARADGLISQKPFEWEKNLYECPIYSTNNYEGGVITVYPDGNVARCCSAERGANFGFGNAITDPWALIVDNMAHSKIGKPGMDKILREGHQMLKEEFPKLLPKEGAAQPCEVCSPIMSNRQARQKLMERMGDPKLFLS